MNQSIERGSRSFLQEGFRNSLRLAYSIGDVARSKEILEKVEVFAIDESMGSTYRFCELVAQSLPAKISKREDIGDLLIEQGDFSSAILAYMDVLVPLVMRYTGEPENKDELAQELLVCAFEVLRNPTPTGRGTHRNLYYKLLYTADNFKQVNNEIEKNFEGDEYSEDLDQQIIKREDSENIEVILNTLSRKQQKVLKLRFGLDGDKPMTLEEVGQEFQLTRERIRQVEASALRNFRKSKSKAMLFDRPRKTLLVKEDPLVEFWRDRELEEARKKRIELSKQSWESQDTLGKKSQDQQDSSLQVELKGDILDPYLAPQHSEEILQSSLSIWSRLKAMGKRLWPFAR